ncbi:hydantoinase/oxoprolinase N-terminal domain-containing protein [Bacillus sp. SL00103]
MVRSKNLSICVPLDHHAVQQVMSKGLAGIVISFLHSYQNPVHELQAKAYIKHHYPQL